MLSIFDSAKRKLKKYTKQIKNLKDLSSLSNEELKKKAFNTKDTLELLNIVQEASKRVLGMKPYEVQLIGSMAIIDSNIIEMKTGEGKSLTAAIAATVLALQERKVYVVSVNDYLVNRDREEHFPLFDFFNLSSGVIYSGEPSLFYKKGEYESNIIYTTATELGFDYLRDNMVQTKEQKAQKGLDFVIIDEVDSILIDEANTPLIISEEVEFDLGKFFKINQLVKKLKRGKEIEVKEFLEVSKKANGDFILDDKTLSVYLTEQGISKIEKELKIENLFSEEGEPFIHLIENAIRAHFYYKKNVHYILKDGEVILIDQNTGRLTPGRQLSEGQHQAIEAKENVSLTPFSISKGEISYQKFFKLFKNISGMTGTAATEKQEFLEIFDLEVIEIPTNKPIIRVDHEDKLFLTKKDKLDFFIKKVKEIHKKGQPILIGTTSVEVNEFLEKELSKEGLKFNVLNAKNIEKENEIIANAGKENSITLATNMAGRGVDIKLTEKSKKLGGLFVLGFEKYDNRRIDNQLRGRSGRQGDPGESLFLVSFEDPLLTIFGESEKIKKQLEVFKVKDNKELLNMKVFQKFIEKAQKTIEQANFEGRKNILQFDNVIGKQREIIYSLRNKLLEPFEPGEKVTDIINFAIEQYQEEEYDEEKQEIYKNNLARVIFKNFEVYDNDKELIEKTIRYIYLRNIDKEWVSHLTMLDNLKHGIHLRQYNQKDPVIEFQKEAFKLFETLIPRIKKGILNDLISLKIENKEN